MCTWCVCGDIVSTCVCACVCVVRLWCVVHGHIVVTICLVCSPPPPPPPPPQSSSPAPLPYLTAFIVATSHSLQVLSPEAVSSLLLSGDQESYTQTPPPHHADMGRVHNNDHYSPSRSLQRGTCLPLGIPSPLLSCRRRGLPCHQHLQSRRALHLDHSG